MDTNQTFPNQQPPNNYPNPKLPPTENNPSTISQPANKVLENILEKVEQLILFTYFFIASILFFRFILSLFGASRRSPFVEFVYNLTEPFMFPFVGMFGRTPGVGQYRLEFEVLVALAVYALVMFGLSRLVRIIFR
jgi:uncharacterized protein YggT (Ycf19 family)